MLLVIAPMADSPLMLLIFPLYALFFYFPTLLVYATAFLLLFIPARHLAPRWTAVSAEAATVLTLLLGFALPAAINPTIRATADGYARDQKPAALDLDPVHSVALVEISDLYDPMTVCDDFCTSLLLSGTAKEVLVAGRRIVSAERMPGDLVPTRYTLVDDTAHCVVHGGFWEKYFIGKPFADVRGTGGFSEGFDQRFGNCIRKTVGGSIDADVTFLRTPPTPNAATIAGVDWRLRAAGVRDRMQRLDRVNGAMIERIRRNDFYAFTLASPLAIDPIGTGAGPFAYPGYWSHTPYRSSDFRPVAFLDGWWPMIANGEAIYRKVTAFGGAGP